jgi:RNA polymerase-binding transcription factor DksA
MAKTPLKTTKSVAKSTPVKKAATVSKATSAKSTLKEVAKKVVTAVASKLSSKTSVTAKKVVAPVSKKEISTPKVAPAKTTVKGAVKTEVAKKVVTSSKTPAAAPVKPEPVVSTLTGSKQVIVPSKPAINPRPSKAEAVKEVSKSNKPVAIPKTSTDKKVDYEPDFTKSVLDSPVQQTNNPTMRYSDAELQEFRDLINKKLDAAKKELAYLQGLITRKDEMGGDETDNRYMTMEDGSMSMEREQLSQMASRQITFIDHLEKAIMRIENKTYGICRVTGKLIDKARLRAVPHATLSMEAKLGIVK